MATETISKSYPSGYYLKPAFQTLDITASGSVGGAGVTTSANQPSTIFNLGSVKGSTNGISLSDGGSIINGSASATTALIEGTAPITASKVAASITNYGTIKSDPHPSFYSYSGYETYAADSSIFLAAGGTITNAAFGTIANGIAVSGAKATITNLEVINSSYYPVSPTGMAVFTAGYAINLLAGGSVVNGSATNTTASINGYTYGVAISGGVGTVKNYGSIKASYGYSQPVGVELDKGGTIVNGSLCQGVNKRLKQWHNSEWSWLADELWLDLRG